MALKISANLNKLTQRERQFFRAVANLFLLGLIGPAHVANPVALAGAAAQDAIMTQAAVLIASMFPDLDVQAVDDAAPLPPDTMFVN